MQQDVEMESAKFADLGKRSRRTNVALNRQHLLAGWPAGQVIRTARLFRLFHSPADFQNVLSPLRSWPAALGR